MQANLEVLGATGDDWPEQMEFPATPLPGQSVVMGDHEGRVREVFWWAAGVPGAVCELWVVISSYQ